MKVARYLSPTDAQPQLGIVIGGKFVSLKKDYPELIDMKDLIARWHTAAPRLKELAEQPGEPLTQRDLQAPIAQPGKILALGLNYADHVAEAGLQKPEHQIWFCKHANCVNGPFADVQIPKASAAVDYEVELVVVIGKRGRHISRTDAPSHVFGYCVGNDVTARDWQMRTPQWMLGKSFDTHAPFGPWITTADEVGDPHVLDIWCTVNGEPRQRSNTRHMIFNVWDQIALLSQAMTLEPGDLIFTGTPAGVGIGMNPRQILRAGDIVCCEVSKLGHIENHFVVE